MQLHQEALSAVEESEAQRLQQVQLLARSSSTLRRRRVFSTAILQELEGKMDETNATAQEVRGKLRAMQSAINFLGSFGDSEMRIMVTVHFTLVTKFTDLLSECVICNCNVFDP